MVQRSNDCHGGCNDKSDLDIRDFASGRFDRARGPNVLPWISGTVKKLCLFYKETPNHCPIPHSQNGTMAKDASLVGKVYWRRERAHDKAGERVVFVICTVGAFIG